MPTTPTSGLPYPSPSSAPDVAGDIYALAAALDPFRNTQWAAYTPVWSNAGFQSTSARWRYIAGKIRVHITATNLNSNAANNQQIAVTLPVNAVANQAGGGEIPTGYGYRTDSGTRTRLAFDLANQGTLTFLIPSGNTEVQLTTANLGGAGSNFVIVTEYNSF